MKKFNSFVKRDWYILLLVAAGFVLGACFYPRLPARVPIHWDASGNVNGYGSRLAGAFIIPLLNLGVYLLFVVLPHIDPRAKNYDKFNSSYQVIKCLVIATLLGMQAVALLVATGVPININIIAGISVSILLIVIGNVMGRFRHNYFVGIKTPWTLANEEVWRKTHRMAGPIWILGGIANLALVIWGGAAEEIGLISIVAVLVLVPFVYSYLAFQKIGGSR
jgi:uncharacterized membrane protein